jgi:hypothetical protein
MVALALLVGVAAAAHAAPDLTAEQALPRVQHHLREAEILGRHFQTTLDGDCKRFSSPEEWRGYFNSEVDQVVLLVAHVEQAWVEAKRTGDDDVRRLAKTGKKRVDEARGLVDKMQGCASENGATFNPMTVWKKVEREMPRRQVEITLPEATATSPTPAAVPASR